MTELMRTTSATLSRLWTGSARHLTDDELTAVATGETVAQRTLAHLDQCQRCASSLVHAADAIDLLQEEASASFDKAYTTERHQAQRRRIGRRLATLVGTESPGKVIHFPFSGRPLPQLSARSGHWIAVASAASLVIGVSAGQLLHFHAAPAKPISSDGVAVTESAQTVPLTFDMTGTVKLPLLGDGLQHPAGEWSSLTLEEFDELMGNPAFFGNDDLALTNFLMSEFGSIDALTPHVSDLPVNIQ
tara:strand:+ start:248 stop:985 length:738 start_codon:yes stop_codon:yes gene_type:complete